jgi:hypothetical protein
MSFLKTTRFRSGQRLSSDGKKLQRREKDMGEITKPRRRSAIRPLCPIHLDKMSGPNQGKLEYYSCSRKGCDLDWSAESDYFSFYQDAPLRTFLQLQEEVLCSKPVHGHKFIAKTKWGRAVWECSVEGCPETEQRPLPPATLWELPKEKSRSAGW